MVIFYTGKNGIFLIGGKEGRGVNWKLGAGNLLIIGLFARGAYFKLWVGRRKLL